MKQLYVGSYNAPVLTGDGSIYHGNGNGITHYEFDEMTGELFERESLPEAQNASWLAFSPDGRRLYAVNELDDYEGTKGGAVSAYAVEMDGSLHFLNRLPVMGAAPCHVDCAPEEGSPKYVYTANYNGGSMSAIRLKADGSLEALDLLLQHEAAERPCHTEESYPQSTEKKHPHVHSSSVYKRILWITDLGLDTIEAYRLNEAGGLETSSPFLRFELPEGSGPRSLAFCENRIFVSCELSNEIAVLEWSEQELTLLQKISTLPKTGDDLSDRNPKTESHVGGIQISPDGKYLYAGNRGHDSIVVFAVERDRMIPVQWAPAGGSNPRGFSLSPSGKWLLAAGQNSGSLTVMKRDEKTGMLKPERTYEAGAVVCLLFGN